MYALPLNDVRAVSVLRLPLRQILPGVGRHAYFHVEPNAFGWFQNRLNEAISHQIQWYESIFRQLEMNSGEKKVDVVAAVVEIWLFKST